MNNYGRENKMKYSYNSDSEEFGIYILMNSNHFDFFMNKYFIDFQQNGLTYYFALCNAQMTILSKFTMKKLKKWKKK